MASKNLRNIGIAVFDTGIAALVFEGTKGIIGNYPAGALMLLVIGGMLYVQGMEYEDESPEERVLGGSDE